MVTQQKIITRHLYGSGDIHCLLYWPTLLFQISCAFSFLFSEKLECATFWLFTDHLTFTKLTVSPPSFPKATKFLMALLIKQSCCNWYLIWSLRGIMFFNNSLLVIVGIFGRATTLKKPSEIIFYEKLNLLKRTS